eukprot:XP_011664998.1 PREDICTED: cyclin-C-like [Strongylocentrotus purpuratus]
MHAGESFVESLRIALSLMCPTSYEFGPLINSRLISACQSVVKKLPYAFSGQEFPYTIKSILECEFYVLEIMDCCLIVYHPYRPLIQYASDLGQEDQLLPLAW